MEHEKTLWSNRFGVTETSVQKKKYEASHREADKMYHKLI